MLYIDAHNHLQDERLSPSIDHIFKECERVEIVASVANGTCPADWQRISDMASLHPWIIPSFGVHPWYIQDLPTSWFESLTKFLDSTPSAVGEVGIDGWRKEFDASLQEEIFLRQLSLAAERNLPVSIHGLRRWGRLLELLQRNPLPNCGFLLHSYGGPAEMIPAFSKLGGYFSCPGFFLQHGREMKLRVFREIPRDRLLIESDAPDQNLPTELDPYQLHSLKDPSKRINHPANIQYVYTAVARLLDTPEEQLAQQTSENFHRLFGDILNRRSK